MCSGSERMRYSPQPAISSDQEAYDSVTPFLIYSVISTTMCAVQLRL